MKVEEFVQIEGEENFEISTNGRVRNKKTGKYRKLQITKKGYQCVNLTKRYRVHRLVAETFIPNPENKPEVHHIDGNPANNSVDNLMWVTWYEHHLLHGGEKVTEKILNSNKGKPIKRIDPYHKKPSVTYRSINEAERHNSISDTSIKKVLKGERRTAGGWFWKYA